MNQKEFDEVLSSIVDEDFKNAIKAVTSCRAFIKAGYSIDGILADNLYYVCKCFAEDYQNSLNGRLSWK